MGTREPNKNPGRPATRLRVAIAAFAFAAGTLGGCGGGENSETAEPRESRVFRVTAPKIPSEAASRRLMHQLAGPPGPTADRARAAILKSGDQRFTAVFIELMEAAGLGILPGATLETYVPALEQLTGQAFGSEFGAWMEWYGRSDLEPPPGFTGWKGQLFWRIDPRYQRFLRDRAPSRIRIEEIRWGGVPVDAIPPLDQPAVLRAAEAEYLAPADAVFGLVIEGEARAYPLRIVDWHEMVNDTLGGVPVSLAYCTLCGAGIAYDGRAEDGKVYTFGTSGLLYFSNKLMYDRQTRTLWNQFTGEPVLGVLVEKNVRLRTIPIVLTTWSDWLEEHPETTVLDIRTGVERRYEPGAAYGDYFSSPKTMFPVSRRDDRLSAKDWVYGLALDGKAKAFALKIMNESRTINDRVGETSVLLVATRGPVVVKGRARDSGEQVEYQAGMAVRAYDREDETFTEGTEEGTLLDSAGRTWRVTEESLDGPAGASLPRLAGHLAYWFGWYAFHPETDVYSASSPTSFDPKP